MSHALSSARPKTRLSMRTTNTLEDAITVVDLTTTRARHGYGQEAA